MKKILFIFLILIVLFSCKNKLTLEQRLIKHEEKIQKLWNCTIDSIYEGNFTDSGYREILVCFKLLHKKEHAEFNDTKVFLIDDKSQIIKAYDVFYKKNGSKNTNYIEEIDNFDNTYRNTVITDFNKNGKLEIIYYHEEGSVSVFYIEEFKNGYFQHVCPTYNGKLRLRGIDNYDLKHFDFEQKSIYLDERHTNKKIRLIWNPETEFYDEEVLQE